jgi:hypothetical protein
VVELGYIVEPRQYVAEILASFQDSQMPPEARDNSARAWRTVRQPLEYRMSCDERNFRAASLQEIVT